MNAAWFRDIAVSVALLFTWTASSFAEVGSEFHPKDLGHLEFFIESVQGMIVAANASAEAYESTGELTPTELVWSDQQRFPHGTVRWWWDQSPQGKPTKRKNKPFQTGRSFGQDDHDRPGFIPDGCNGKPCARGGLVPDGEQGRHKYHYKQPCYFELQPEDRFSFEGPFSVFLLVRPVPQERDFVYFGAFHWSTLKHQVADNSLHFKNGRFAALTGPDAIQIGKWQLIEVHRDEGNKLRCVVNGRDRTHGVPVIDGPFRLVHIMNNNKNIWKSADSFTGDLSAFAVYSDVLVEEEQQDVRHYFEKAYGFKGVLTAERDDRPSTRQSR
ncbi:MAG: hypothetical protein QGG71_10960 [Pirellulaceae bacterium]|nr:hypothetical protein [Pirellulaceae bacterium]